jgi:predicted GH43/DUF377 family glycosyl hydrolase
MKQLSCLLIILILLLSGCCKNNENPEWIKNADPVMLPGSGTDWDRESVGAGSVIYHSNKYHMWYTGGPLLSETYIGYATSPDGIIWTKDNNNPVLAKGTAGSWEESFVHNSKVMVINNTFHMWYTAHKGIDGSFDFQIGHATSADGVTWIKDPNNPVLKRGSSGSWDYAWISVGSVLYDGTRYHLYYMGYNGINSIRIGHATSSDGLTWTKDPSNPVLVSGSNGDWDNPRVDFPTVIFDGTTYHMWYSGGDYFKWKIGYATSTNGSNWTKSSSNPVLSTGQPGNWDYRSVTAMSVIDNSGKYKMWYWGSRQENYGSIGYAELPHD